MAKAIILGAIDARLLLPSEVVIVEPDAQKRAGFKSWNVHATPDYAEALSMLTPTPTGVNIRDVAFAEGLGALGGQVMLAVKPQSLDEAAASLAPLLATTPRVIISILAGVRLQRLSDALGSDLPIVRVMPNTPARLRKGMTAIATRGTLTRNLPPHAVLAHDLFASIGEVVRINEVLMDAYTALAGSGPAYIFYLAEAMLDAATELGLDRITADRVVRQTIAGAAALLNDSSHPPQSLRQDVTSKGGTTQAATDTLDAMGVKAAIVEAIRAGTARGSELSRQS